ncbi:MAG TPA: SRPBCC family protein [Pseudonocardia sp.]|nr:SRPBCC family protein [Pseudonocardia sp.]
MGRLARQGRLEVRVEAPPTAVWEVLADVTRTGEWSHECRAVEWIGAPGRPVPGARFRGRNRYGRLRWSRVNEVQLVDAPRSFGWRTVPSPLYPDSTEWRIHLEPDGAGTRIVQEFRVVRLNPLLDRLFWLTMTGHRDRRAALAADLQRLGALAAGEDAPTGGAPARR